MNIFFKLCLFIFCFLAILFIDIKISKAFNRTICPNYSITATGGYNKTSGPTLEQSSYFSPYSFPVAKPMSLGQDSPVVSFKVTPTRSFSGQTVIALMRYDYRPESHGGNGTKTVDTSFYTYGQTSLYAVGDTNYGSWDTTYGYQDPVYDTGRTGYTWYIADAIPDMVAYRVHITYPNYTTCESDLVYVKMAGYHFNATRRQDAEGNTIVDYSLDWGGNAFTFPDPFRKVPEGKVAVMIYDSAFRTGEWFSPGPGTGTPDQWISKGTNIGSFWGKSTPRGLPNSGTINLGKFYQGADQNKRIGLIVMGDPIDWTTGATPPTQCPSPLTYLNPNYCYVVSGYEEIDPYLIESRKLTVVKAGTGSATGKVISGAPGIDCGSTCTANFAKNAQFALSASWDPGTEFTGWSGGGCSGVGLCQVTMDVDKTITANFNLIPQIRPNVSTLSYDQLTPTSVKVRGRVNDFGSSPGLDRGFYISDNQTCDTSDVKYPVPPLGSVGDMSVLLTGITQGWGYYMAYAQNSNITNSFDYGSCNRFETAPPPPAVNVTITATPSTINLRQSTTVGWSSTNANNCTGSSVPSTSFNPDGATSGTQDVTPAITGNHVFTVTCTGAGPSGTASKTVLVNSAPVGGSSGSVKVKVLWDKGEVQLSSFLKDLAP